MANNTPKIYAPGSAKRRDVDWFCVRLGINAEKMIAFLNQHKNAKGYVNLDLTERREPDQYGNTHSLTLDTWQPKQRADAETMREGFKQVKAATNQAPEEPSDIPF